MKITYENSLLQQILNLNKINKISCVSLNKEGFDEVYYELKNDYYIDLNICFEDNGEDIKHLLLDTVDGHIMFKKEELK